MQHTPTTLSNNSREWSSLLQRRVMRLLLVHDQGLFRSHFRTFYTESDLPQMPLLRQYDRYIRLLMLSDELLDDILPRIRRQLSLQTDSARLLEESPTRGDIDWNRTFERTLRETPGLPPLQFDTRLRQRSTTTPENLLTVAVLLAYRQEVQHVLSKGLDDEALSEQERQVLVGADERAERELAAAYARALIDEAMQCDIELLVEQVAARLRPGMNPYRDVIDWWQRLQRLTVGRASGNTQLAVASQRDDEKTDPWLYELWLALELIHLLHEKGAVSAEDTSIERDRLHCVFTWQGRRFRFHYNRQREESVGVNAAWQHGPASRPDYTIEREHPLEVSYQGTTFWREPAFVLDAKYYLGGSDPTRTHGPIKKLLGDMTLLDAEHGALFFSLLPEPVQGTHITRTLSRKPHRHSAGRAQDMQISLYSMHPNFSVSFLQERLTALLDHAASILPERPLPTCQGVWLDADTIHASSATVPIPRNTIVCPKPHIGPNVFDLVNAETDCLKNPRVCHVIGQGIVRPEVVRVTSKEDLEKKSSSLRTRGDALLKAAEEAGDEQKAEQLRTQIFTGIGNAVEQLTALRGDTRPFEDTFKRWIFKEHWNEGTRQLATETRSMLLSGEYVWHEYDRTGLSDWAAPAIQYCRALEFEVRRRLYKHNPTAFKLPKAGWTLGAVKYMYQHRTNSRTDAPHNWRILQSILATARCDVSDFEMRLQRMVDNEVVDHRNHLAHGEPIQKEVAELLRDTIIGDGGNMGILCWLVRNTDPV